VFSSAANLIAVRRSSCGRICTTLTRCWLIAPRSRVVLSGFLQAIPGRELGQVALPMTSTTPRRAA
jgi:hypothetical protein